MEISWTTYLAANNLEGVNNVLRKYGYAAAFNEEEAEDAIRILQNECGEKATVDLLKEHPDFDIIVDTYHEEHPMQSYQNANGTEFENIQTIPVQQPVPQLVSTIPAIDHFSVTFQNVVLVVMAFWLIKSIIDK